MIVDDYARVQGILIAAVAAFVVFITIIGPECVPSNLSYTLFFSMYFYHPRNHGSRFEKHKIAVQEGAADSNAEMDKQVVLHEVEASTRMGSILEDQEKSSVKEV